MALVIKLIIIMKIQISDDNDNCFGVTGYGDE